MPVRIIGGDAIVCMGFGSGIVPHEELGGPEQMMRFEEQGWIVRSAGRAPGIGGQARQLRADCQKSCGTRPSPQSADEQLALVTQLLAKRTRLGEGLQDLRRAPAPGRHHGHAHGVLEMNLLPQAASVSGRDATSSSPLPRWAIASRFADRFRACCPAFSQ